MNARFRTWPAALILLAALLPANFLLSRPAHAADEMDVDINYFYDALAPYGNWVDHELYGPAWYPTDVPANWRPYTYGHWEYAEDYGWVWESHWEWGWAPFHYGRWVWDDEYGWLWLPGRVWAPAWVIWRYGGGYAAWAPMPPNLIWHPLRGLVTEYFDYDRDLPGYWWVVVPERHLHRRNVNRYLIDPSDNGRYLRRARTYVNIHPDRDIIVNRGVPVRQIEKRSGVIVRPLHLRDVERIEDRKRGVVEGHLPVFRPHFRNADGDQARREQALAENLRRQNAMRRRHPSEMQRGPEQSRPFGERRQNEPFDERAMLPQQQQMQEQRRQQQEAEQQQQMQRQRQQAEQAQRRQQQQMQEQRRQQQEAEQQQQRQRQRQQAEQSQRRQQQQMQEQRRQQQEAEQQRQMQDQQRQMERQRQQAEQAQRRQQQQMQEQRRQQKEAEQQRQMQDQQRQMERQRQQAEQAQRRQQQQQRPESQQRQNDSAEQDSRKQQRQRRREQQQ